MDLSKNFKLSEFTKSRFAPGGVVEITPQQQYCVQMLVDVVLQPIRDAWGPMKITSGVRNKAVYDGLIKAGYPASKTSDHFAWGPMNPYGVGAADFVTLKKPIQDVYVWIKANLDEDIGQSIIYPDMNFIHISNAWEAIFPGTPERKRGKYLVKYKGKGYVLYKDGMKIT